MGYRRYTETPLRLVLKEGKTVFASVDAVTDPCDTRHGTASAQLYVPNKLVKRRYTQRAWISLLSGSPHMGRNAFWGFHPGTTSRTSERNIFAKRPSVSELRATTPASAVPANGAWALLSSSVASLERPPNPASHALTAQDCAWRLLQRVRAAAMPTRRRLAQHPEANCLCLPNARGPSRAPVPFAETARVAHVLYSVRVCRARSGQRFWRSRRVRHVHVCIRQPRPRSLLPPRACLRHVPCCLPAHTVRNARAVTRPRAVLLSSRACDAAAHRTRRFQRARPRSAYRRHARRDDAARASVWWGRPC